MGPDLLESTLIGVIFEGIFYGLYCMAFGVYVRIQLKKQDAFKGLLPYALTLIFILCTAFLGVDMTYLLQLLQASCPSSSGPTPALVYYLELGTNVLYTCIDLISQGILIYRCWILWHRLSIVAIPVILSLAYLGISLPAIVIIYNEAVGISVIPTWYAPAVISLFFISLGVNALATGLIILKMIIESKARTIDRRPSYDLYLNISILLESGLITFVAQLVQIILYMVELDNFAYSIVSRIVVILYGISPTLVLVRVAMGLTYDTETLGIPTSHTLRFAGVESNANQTIGVVTENNLEDTLRDGKFESNNNWQTLATTGNDGKNAR